MLHVLILASILDIGGSASTTSVATVPEPALFQTGQAISRNSDVLAFVEEMVQGTVGRARRNKWTMTAEEKEAIEHAKQVIRDMVNGSLVQHHEDQAEVDRARNLIENCSTLTKAHLETSAGALQRVTNQSREQHSMCRDREFSLFAEWDRICQIYTAYREHNSSAHLPACASTAALSDEFIQTDDLDTLKQMEACLVAMHKWEPPLYDPYWACKQAREEAANSTAQCNIKQRHFETGFCDYVIRLEDVCNYQHECRAMTINARTQTHESVHISVSARKSDHTAASKILCLFDVLDIEDPEDKKMLLHECDTRNHSVDNALFFIDYHDIPPAYPCDANATRPGNENWLPEAYGDESWFGSLDLAEPEACLEDTLADLGDLTFSLHDDVHVNDSAETPSGAVLLDSGSRTHARIKEEIAKWHGSKHLAKGQHLAARSMALLGLGTHGRFKAEQVRHNKERAVFHRLQSQHAAIAVLNGTEAHHASHIPRVAVRF